MHPGHTVVARGAMTVVRKPHVSLAIQITFFFSILAKGKVLTARVARCTQWHPILSAPRCADDSVRAAQNYRTYSSAETTVIRFPRFVGK